MEKTPADPLSKKSRKRVERAESKKQAKQEHQAMAHAAMLQYARRLRETFQSSSTTAVPEGAFYSQLPRAGRARAAKGAPGAGAAGASALILPRALPLRFPKPRSSLTPSVGCSR